jgi:hypothetical protein
MRNAPNHIAIAKQLHNTFQTVFWPPDHHRKWEDATLAERARWIAVAIFVRPGTVALFLENARAFFESDPWDDLRQSRRRAAFVEKWHARLRDFFPTTIQISLGPDPKEMAEMLASVRAMSEALGRAGIKVELKNMPTNGASTASSSPG